MRISIKTLIAVLLIVMSFAEAQAVHVLEVIELSGTVFDVDQHFRRIWITPDDGETLEIIGFPFYNLEAQLEEECDEPIAIYVGDCVTITYYVKYNEVNKWLSLTKYCGYPESCESEDCYVNENGLERKSQRNKNRPNPWPWHGKPPRHRR